MNTHQATHEEILEMRTTQAIAQDAERRAQQLNKLADVTAIPQPDGSIILKTGIKKVHVNKISGMDIVYCIIGAASLIFGVLLATGFFGNIR